MNPSEAAEHLEDPESHLDAMQRAWLKPLGPTQRWLQHVLYYVNKGLMRALFRVEVHGRQHVPAEPPYLITPNHTSSLDPAALAAALDYPTLRRTRWAGRKGAVTRTRFRRWVNRLAQTVPIDRDVSALAAGAAVLRQGENLVWFPEGTRTQTGDLQEFQPGICLLQQATGVPILPVYIDGAYQAMPPSAVVPRRLSRITVRFGEPLEACETPDVLRSRVEQLKQSASS